MQNKITTIFMGITASCLLFLSICVLLVGLVYIPKIDYEINQIDKAVENLIDASNQLLEIDLENINLLVQESRESVVAAGEKIDQIDIETLNDAIKNLNDTIAPIADFINSLS